MDLTECDKTDSNTHIYHGIWIFTSHRSTNGKGQPAQVALQSFNFKKFLTYLYRVTPIFSCETRSAAHNQRDTVHIAAN